MVRGAAVQQYMTQPKPSLPEGLRALLPSYSTVASTTLWAGWEVTKFAGRRVWSIVPTNYITPVASWIGNGAALGLTFLTVSKLGRTVITKAVEAVTSETEAEPTATSVVGSYATSAGAYVASQVGSLAMSAGSYVVETGRALVFEEVLETTDFFVNGTIKVATKVTSLGISAILHSILSNISSFATGIWNKFGNFSEEFMKMGAPAQIVAVGYPLLLWGSPRLKKKIRNFCIGPDLPLLAQRESSCQTPLGAYIQKVIKDLEWERPWIKKVDESKPILNKDIKEQVEPFIAANKQIASGEDGFFKNMLLLGPPGTGKTMLAKYIARESGMNYIEIDGGTFAMWERHEEGMALKLLKGLLEYVEQSGRPVLLLIDEADGVLQKPEAIADTRPKQSDLHFRSALLAATNVSNKLLVVMTTNHADKMDRALLSRTQMKVKMTPPDSDARVEILTKYIDKHFEEAPERKTCLSDEKIKELAEKTEGLSGRDLMFLVDNFVTAKKSARDKTLSPEMMTYMLELSLQAFKEEYDTVPHPQAATAPAADTPKIATAEKVEPSSEKVADRGASDQAAPVQVVVNAK